MNILRSCIVFTLLISFVASQTVVPITFNTPTTCTQSLPQSSSITRYFHTGNLSCLSCPPNSIPSQDGLTCNCMSGYRLNSSSDCEECTNAAVSQDGLFCLSCHSSLVFDNGECTGCNMTSIYVDTLPLLFGNQYGERRCTQCPINMWAGNEKTSCVKCGIDDCTNCNRVSGGVCFTVEPSPPINQPFSYYTNYFSSSRELCNNGNQTACQLLVNLCVLQTYNRQDEACQEVIRLASSLPSDVPILFYPQYSADQYLTNTVVNTRYTPSSSSLNASRLTLYAAQFALNGTFLGLEMVTDSLMLCKDRPSVMAAAWQIGVQYEISCSLDPLELMNDPILYDLFLLDGDQLVPVPILVDGYRDNNGVLVNQDNNKDQWQFVRRFYLFQSITDTPSYVESFSIIVQVISGGGLDGGRIQPPYINIKYQPIPSNNPKTSFTVQYSFGYNQFNLGLSITGAILVVAGVIYSILKTNGFMRRTGSNCCEPQTLLYLLIRLFSVHSNLFLLLVSVTGVFWLIFYKTHLFLALPLLRYQEVAFITLLSLATLFRFLQIVYLIWKQTSIEIFLIDWEKPKITSSLDTPNVTPTPVSIWRTYFVANEWNEIQTLRKLNSFLVLVMTVLFLEVIGLKNIAERDPGSHVTTPPSRYSAPHSSVLRLGLAVSFYILFAFITRVYMILIHERYIEHKIHQFVDLCSVSNVSIFILSESLFGHYIHGRSVHGRADTNMREMNDNLIKEKEDMCSRRGLLPDSDEQTFEVLVSRIFHTNFYKVLSTLHTEEIENNRMEMRPVSESSLKTHEELTQFLSSFIDHNLPNCDYVFRKKMIIEKLLGMELKKDSIDRSVFYTDTDISFTDVLFYGSEWQLLSLELLVFLLVDVIAHNYILAAIITYIVSKVVSLIREILGRRNLIKKTLIDSRFLI